MKLDASQKIRMMDLFDVACSKCIGEQQHIVAEMMNLCRSEESSPVNILLGAMERYLLMEMGKEALAYTFEKLWGDQTNDLFRKIIEIADSDQWKTEIAVENAPHVCVLIATYNRKEYLSEALDSVLSQDYPDFRVIVTDDCSSDGTEQLMLARYTVDSRITYIRNTNNRGVAMNRHSAFNGYADGEYILFLDDDDFILDRNYFSKAVAFLETNPSASFVAADVFQEYDKSDRIELTRLGLNPMTDRHEFFLHFQQLGYPKPVSTLTTMFRFASLVEAGLKETEMVNDSMLYQRALLAGDGGYINTLAGVYRIHGQNISFHCSLDFIYSNVLEKQKIDQLASSLYGYRLKELETSEKYAVYHLVRFYMVNSAKSPKCCIELISWLKKHATVSYQQMQVKYWKLAIQNIARLLIRRS